jgi:hypothetical protein
MNLAALPPAIRTLLSEDRLFALGPGQPNTAARPALEAMTIESLFGAAKVGRPDLAQCCLAALWLYHDFLDRSHTISQDIAGAEGSWWHGIMHRREPDYGNAGYWFRRVGKHPVCEPLRRRAAELATAAGSPAGSAFFVRQSAWNSLAFIELCEASMGGDPACELLCRQVQRAEWDLLFAHCFQANVEASRAT